MIESEFNDGSSSEHGVMVQVRRLNMNMWEGELQSRAGGSEEMMVGDSVAAWSRKQEAEPSV